MSVGLLAQIAIDLFLGAGLFVCAMRIAREPKDDPRLSRGLQLLQSKIAVLEDLADKSETQAQQLTALLEQKSLDVQARIEEAERHVQAIKASMQRSLEVAKIFEDKIPHHEIIERQNAAKYVNAARLAHDGVDAEEIARRVDLPRGEIEFIAKVNKDRLMFSEAQLPWWAGGQDGIEFAPEASPAPSFSPPPAGHAPAIAYAPPSEAASASLERLGEEFRRACLQAGLPGARSVDSVHFSDEAEALPLAFEADHHEASHEPEAEVAAQAHEVSPEPDATAHAPVQTQTAAQAPAQTQVPVQAAAPQELAKASPVIRLVEFPRIAAVRPTDNLR